MFQTFFRNFFVFIIKRTCALSLSHLSRLSSLGKRVQKYTLLEYHPNLFYSFFELFLNKYDNSLIDNDVVEHVF